ncbi:SPARC/Testican calcium-binding domain [Trinorchestia longiramus]|nr:SPARC/Testican calcium-binding domain [Trinorchestia longiramus]
MKRALAAALLCLCVTAVLVQSAENKKGKSKNSRISEIEKKLDALLELEAELENEIVEATGEQAEEQPIFYQIEEQADPCEGMVCSAGRSCVVTVSGKGACHCVEACEEETDPRRRVCSNHNETWMTDCDLHRQRCLCNDGLQGCQDDKYKHLHIDYYGQCQQLPECEDEELADFPRRMREWLFSVMRDMADRQILSEHYEKLEREAEEDESQKWSNAVVWKWCDLDGHPKDKMVSRHELFPLRAPLLTLEHCIAPFLDSCDPDNNHQITLKEWGKCLQLDEEDLSDMDDLCEDIRDQEGNIPKYF